MTSRDFAYWLQGFMELSDGDKGMTPEQMQSVKKHLAMVFIHEIDPSFPADQQKKLNEAHNSGSKRPSGDVVYRC